MIYENTRVGIAVEVLLKLDDGNMGFYRNWILLIPLCLSVSSCTQENPDHNSDSSSRYSAFSISAVGEVDPESIKGIQQAIEANLPRITENMAIRKMPLFSLKVWSDPEQFKTDFEQSGGRGDVTRGYVNTELMEIRVLDGDGIEAIAVHEFAHLAMYVVNPTIAANPFWLWESVALYEDGSGPPDTSRLTCISTGESPSLSELSNYPGTTKVYRMGYLLIDYIVTHWDRKALVRLIQSNGDIESILGVTQATFEANWHSYVLANYDFGSEKLPMTAAELTAHLSGNTLTNEELRMSTYLAVDGHFSIGYQKVVQATGQWQISDADEFCLDLGQGEPQCSRWYEKGESRYWLASNADCVFQEWKLTPGDSQGLAVNQ